MLLSSAPLNLSEMIVPLSRQGVRHSMGARGLLGKGQLSKYNFWRDNAHPECQAM